MIDEMMNEFVSAIGTETWEGRQGDMSPDNLFGGHDR